MIALPTLHKPYLETVPTGKQFHVFPLHKTEKRFTPVGKRNIYDRYILLDTNGVLPLLPIRLYAGATHMSRSNAISPYPDEGNQNTEGDIDYAVVPLCLDASIHAKELRNLKLTQQTHTLPDPLLSDVKETLTRLRFHIALPTRNTLDAEKPIYDMFISRPDETALILGELSFRHFTPQKSLSHSTATHSTQQAPKGYFLMLPSDDTIIQNIQGQFIMLPPETPHER